MYYYDDYSFADFVEEKSYGNYIPASILEKFRFKAEVPPPPPAVEETPAPVVESPTSDLNILTQVINPNVVNVPPPKPLYQVEMENATFERGFVNVIDPITGKSNLSNEVDETGYIAIVTAFAEGYKLFQKLCDGIKTIHANR